MPIYQRCVSQLNAHYVDIGKIAHVIGQDACKALPSLHAFTGCDAVSAFAGIGKVKPLKKLLSKKEYQCTFQQLEENWLMSEDLLMHLEAFVCDIYGVKNGISDVNQCRYSVFPAKKGNNNNNNNNNSNNSNNNNNNNSNKAKTSGDLHVRCRL